MPVNGYVVAASLRVAAAAQGPGGVEVRVHQATGRRPPGARARVWRKNIGIQEEGEQNDRPRVMLETSS